MSNLQPGDPYIETDLLENAPSASPKTRRGARAITSRGEENDTKTDPPGELTKSEAARRLEFIRQKAREAISAAENKILQKSSPEKPTNEIQEEREAKRRAELKRQAAELAMEEKEK